MAIWPVDDSITSRAFAQIANEVLTVLLLFTFRPPGYRNNLGIRFGEYGLNEGGCLQVDVCR